MYISKEVVDFRKDCPTVAEAEAKVRRMVGPRTLVMAGSGVLSPILVCELGARKRGLNLEVAAADARHWWQTGLVPLRPTPLAGETASAAQSASSGQCFIATAACGTDQAEEVVRLRAFRDTVLRKTSYGRALIRIYQRLSPPVARLVARSDLARRLVRRLIVGPAARLVDRRA
jgi:hypothetical protein